MSSIVLNDISTNADSLLTGGTPSALSLVPVWCTSSERLLLPVLYPQSRQSVHTLTDF